MKKYNKKLILLMDAIFLIVSISLIYQIYSKQSLYKENYHLNNSLQNNIKSQDYLTSIKKQLPLNTHLPKNRDLLELKKCNSDLIGWIYIPGTAVDYPIVQYSDNSFYLNHTFDKKESFAGSIYMDYRNTLFKDQNTIIYGHSLNDGSMFSDLNKFKNKEYFSNNNTITIVLFDQILIYEIFSVYTTDKEYDYRTPEYNNPNDFENFLKEIYDRSIVSSKNNPQISDKILTLSTCNDGLSDKRLAVHAILKKCIQLD